MEFRVDKLHWPDIVVALATAERALGRLAHALEITPLHGTWLWRELVRVSVLVAQARGFHARVDHLRLALIGVPFERGDHTPGLADARRVFLSAAPLFRKTNETDSRSALWPRDWDPDGGSSEEIPPADRHEVDRGVADRAQLVHLVDELTGFAGDGRRPALINLLVDLREKAAERNLPPALVRITLPLALVKAGLVPKAAPGLLGGRRLALGMSRASPDARPLTPWLASALGELAREADLSRKRLAELTCQHQAWHKALSEARLRKHARAPAALDLLAATPVLTIGLVADHLDISHVAAGTIVARLVDLGILAELTSRSRHKVFIARDLSTPDRAGADVDAPLSLSEPVPAVDVDAVGATLDQLFGELDRQLARTRRAEGAG